VSVLDVADAIEHACALVRRTRKCLALAVENVEQARDVWAQVLEGARSAVGDVPPTAEQARQDIEGMLSILGAFEQLLLGYLDSLGVRSASATTA
jgi:hypothetical protein